MLTLSGQTPCCCSISTSTLDIPRTCTSRSGSPYSCSCLCKIDRRLQRRHASPAFSPRGHSLALRGSYCLPASSSSLALWQVVRRRSRVLQAGAAGAAAAGPVAACPQDRGRGGAVLESKLKQLPQSAFHASVHAPSTIPWIWPICGTSWLMPISMRSRALRRVAPPHIIVRKIHRNTSLLIHQYKLSFPSRSLASGMPTVSNANLRLSTYHNNV